MDADRPDVDFDQVKRKIWAIAYADLRGQVDVEQAYRQAGDRVTQLVSKLTLPSRPRPPY
jgi:anthranilate synthase component 1